MSMVWIYMFANILVDILELFALLTGMSSALLGLTILSWGNSLGDSIASCSIAKKGFGEMALTSCIAGPVFNLMMGLGLATFKNNM
jgi:sodium/potassium/calcium exchanger 6